MPQWLIKMFGKLKPVAADKIFGTLVYDNTQSYKILEFQNPFSTEQGFADMVKWYQSLKIKHYAS
jgi:hypothetical protein